MMTNKKKYHLVNWTSVCRPKRQGGLGVLLNKYAKNACMSGVHQSWGFQTCMSGSA